MIGARILGTGAVVGGRPIGTHALLREAAPGRDPDALAARIGIATRGWVTPEESAASLGADAAFLALADAGVRAGDIRRLVFVTSTSGDRLIPATANDVAERLGLDDTCDAFDINNACVGFLTALDIVARGVATGAGPALIVVGEVFSRYLSPSAPRPYLVMADGAAAAVVGPGGDGGVEAVYLRNRADLRGRVFLDHPGVTGSPAILDFDLPGTEIARSAVDAVRTATTAVLEQAGLTWHDVRWFLPHQPNGELVTAIAAALDVGPDRMVPVVAEIGSVGAVSVPWSLDRLRRQRRLRGGDRVLMAAVGAGTAYGALVYREPSAGGAA